MKRTPIQTVTLINGNVITIEPQITWITKPIGKLSQLRALARLHKAGITT